MVNKSLPFVMHIDLNSCFAIIEQQANRLLRGRPVGVAAYDTPRGFVVAASYEAKAKNIKLGVNVEQSRALCPGIVIMTPDPAKYREAHKLFKQVLLEYSPDVTPKSIDEFILNLEHSTVLKSTKLQIRNSKQKLNTKPKTKNTEQLQISSIKYQISESEARNTKNETRKMSDEYERNLHNQAMLNIGDEIKNKIRQRLGEWVTVNIGIGPNRFLAKYAAGFGKPDGMTLIDHTNLRSKYENMNLTDLPGINTRFRTRLRAVGIYTPLDFLDADLYTLKKRVFKSIVGYYWYLRLRGHEIDAVESVRRSIGHQHALSDKTMDKAKLERLLLKLSEKTGRRLRKNNYYATGIHLYIGFAQDSQQYTVDSLQFKNSLDEGPASFENMPNIRSWHHGEKVHYRLYSTPDIYEAAKKLLYSAEIIRNVRILALTVFDLNPWDPVQTSLFDQTEDWGRNIGDSPHRSYDARKRVSDAVDAINNRYGEFIITPAAMLDMQGTILDRIAFGLVKDME
jgi:DNA polymerase-4